MKKYNKNRITSDGRLIVYSFDPVFFEYTGEDTASPSPLEPGVFHLPAGTTDIKPPRVKKSCTLKFTSDKWINIPVDQSALAKQNAELIRMERDVLLFRSDWALLLDVPESIDRKAWRTYRQQLRDLPQQKGFPMKCQFPIPPTKK